MRRLICIAFIIISFLQVSAKEFKYTTFTISDSLKRNAWAVIRNHETYIEVNSLTDVRTEITKVITVLNKNGKKQGWEAFSYDNNIKISKVEVKIYNALGELVDKWNKSDLKDISCDPYGTTYTDTRLLLAKPISNNYPYTIAYHLVYDQNYTYDLKDWFPIRQNNLSIEKSSYSINCTEDLNLVYKENNLDTTVTKTIKGNTIKWILSDFSALKNESYSPNKEEYLPHVKVKLSNFSYDKYSGSFKNWRELGRFYSKLNKGRGILPIERQEYARSLTDTISSIEGKIKALYEYMQAHTRYISIQVGIGGIQPTDAITVSETGYGDCKALTNYMKALLKAVDINSYFAYVKAGSFEYYFDSNFVSHMGNHVILCVPIKNDTVWLECTSQTMPFGYLGDFTDNRSVLLVTETGGVLAKTPKYNKDENTILRKGTIIINEEGNGEAILISEYTGLEYGDMHNIAIEDKEQQKKLLFENYSIPNFKIRRFKLNTVLKKDPVLLERTEFELQNYATKSGSRLFISPNFASKSFNIPKEISQRKLDIHKRYCASYSDTIIFHIPMNYSVEVIPDIPLIDNKFGKYEAEIIQTENEVVYIRNYEINSGVYKAEEYDNFRNFFKEVNKYDRSMFVLKKD